VKSRGALLAAALGALLELGCETSCDLGEGEPVRFAGGELIGSAYQTSDVDGPFLYFPPDRRLDIVHGLATRDLDVQVYLAFEERGGDDRRLKAAPAAGSQAVIEFVDAERVRVHNDTCAEFYLRLTATARAPVADAAVE
jgi:hypothetical protein